MTSVSTEALHPSAEEPKNSTVEEEKPATTEGETKPPSRPPPRTVEAETAVPEIKITPRRGRPRSKKTQEALDKQEGHFCASFMLLLKKSSFGKKLVQFLIWVKDGIVTLVQATFEF